MKHQEIRGLWLGLLGVLIFSITFPMTRLAVGTEQAPLMSGMFVACGRAVVAAGLSLLYLLGCRAPVPERTHWPALGLVAGGVVFGFPILSSMALQHVEAVHASVITGLMPLATALLGALLNRQRPSMGFWICALLGSLMVAVFALMRSGHSDLAWDTADLWLVAAMGCGAVGYAWGGRLSTHMPAQHVICWALVLSLPITLPLAWVYRPTTPMPVSAWLGFAYAAVFSMWLGFFAWYRGLAIGGTVRVSQTQLLQPFLSMMFSIPILGEQVDVLTLGFGMAIVGTVFLSRKMPVHAQA